MFSFEFCLILFVLGSIFGSFACASVWRLRANEIRYLKKNNISIDKSDSNSTSKLVSKSILKDRSICLHCGHELSWYDLIPMVSWIYLKGKCRYCHKKIGKLELFSEFSLGLIFAVSYIFWPFGFESFPLIIMFVIWLISCILLCVIFIYDLMWSEIPSVISYSYITLGLCYAAINLYQINFNFDALLSIIGSIFVLSIVYLILFVVSKGSWIGFGDIILGFGLALFILKWEYSLVCLFLANLIGTMVVVPGLLSKKVTRTSRVPFGPFLIVGFLITFFFGKSIIEALFSNNY